jgi:signal transduction histidine kinase
MALLVHDLDTQPVAVQQLTAALARSGALAVCATGALPPGWAATVVELPPFHRAAAAEWAQRLLGEGPVHALLDLLWPCTEGRPGALRDATLQLVADGQLTWQGPRWTLDPNATRPRLPARALPTPADDHDAAQLAAALALHEAPASSELLAEVLGWTAGRVVLTADRLRAAGLLDPTAQHLRWRESLRRPPLDPPHAERLHHAWLRAVLGAAPASSEALAAHLRHATELQVVRQHAPAAVEDLLRRDPLAAAALARDLHARWPDDTLALLSLRALFETSQHEVLLHDATALADASPSPETRALARAYLVRVLAHLRPHSPEATEALHQARQEAATPRGKRALDLAEVQLLAARREPGAALSLASQLAAGPAPDALDARDDWARMRTLWAQLALEAQGSDAARRALDPLTDDLPLSPPVRAIVHSVRGRVLLHAGHLPAAEHELRLALAPGSGLTQLDRARSLNNAAILSFQTGDRLRALEHWEAALLVLDRLNLTTERLRTEVNLCIGYREAGRPTRAELAGRWAVQTAQTLRLPHLEAAAASSLCDLHLTTEAYEPALRWHTHAHSLMERHGLEHQRVDLDRQRAEIATHRHEADAAEHAQRAVALAEQRGGAVELARALAVLAVCHARSGEASRAEAALRDALQAATEAGASADVAELRLWAATAWLALGRAEEARQELARVDAYASEVSDTQRRRRVQRLSAQADALRDERHPRHEADRLLQLTVELHRLRDVSEILRRITAALIELPDLDRAFVFVGDELRHAASASRPDAPTDPPPRSILGRCLALRAEVVVADVTERGELRHATSVVNLQLRAALCVPLLDGADVVGILYADSRRAAGEDLQATLSYVRALASHAAIAIGRAAQHRALQQELGERQRLSRSKDEFVASISHELRTPLQAILGHTTELRRRTPHERDEPALHHIERAGRRLLSIIDDLLAYADPVEPAREAASFCLRDLLHQISAPHAAAAAAKGLRWALHVDNAATTELLGHQAPLRDLLDRLLDNAVKFTDTGAVALSAAPSRDLPDTWEFSVRDTGPGLPQRTSHGDAFTLGADATTRRHGGLGLGLALCRRHAIALGSSLVLTCPPTGGTRATFRAHLPRKPGARPPGPLLDATPDRVLVVDDNPVNRLVLSRMVEALGHPCDLAASGAEAVERASERCYLTVLMDCHMPDMDGLQATRHIRQLPVPNRWTPVFAVTADGRGEYRARCLEAGMDQHVVKPVERGQLAEMLRAAAGCWGAPV